jgi:putative ABC transport system permease protein
MASVTQVSQVQQVPQVQQVSQVQQIPQALQTKEISVRSVVTWRSQGEHAITGGATLEGAVDALKANKVRSFLTMLGIIIGVSAVIAVVTLTQGVNKSVNDRFASLGTNVLTISPGTTTTYGARSAAGASQTLTQGDADAVAQLPHVINASPVLSASEQVIYGDQNWSTSVRGVYPDYQYIQNWQLAEGSWFNDQDEQMGSAVAVLGQTVVQNLFPDNQVDPVGQTIRIGGGLFRVIGVLQPKGTQGPINADDVIFIPFSAAQVRLIPSLYVNQIQVQVDNTNDIPQVQAAIISLLRTRHGLPGPDPSQQQQNGFNPPGLLFGGRVNRGGGGSNGPGSSPNRGGSSSGSSSATSAANRQAALQAADPPNDFQVLSVNQFIQTAQENSAILTILLIGIATISLAVGGIGIMNIMLVSVTERTREIGIRMAIGARRRDIRNQFLVEALILSIVGGIIGILLGLGGGLALTLGLNLPFVASPIPAFVAFTVSAAVGVAFGLYPAVRAARLDPIIALRSE